MIDTAESPKLITADDLLRMSKDEFRGELIRGVLCETEIPGMMHGAVISKTIYLIALFIRPRWLGVMAVGVGIWLERDPDTVRAADIAFFSIEKEPPGAERTPGYAENIPDLVVEVESFTDSLTALNDKARMWLTYGVPLVWTIHPSTRSVDVHRPNHPVLTLGEDDELDGYDAIPGFACKAGEVFKIYADDPE